MQNFKIIKIYSLKQKRVEKNELQQNIHNKKEKNSHQQLSVLHSQIPSLKNT